MEYDPWNQYSKFANHVGFTKDDEPVAGFISWQDGTRYGMNESDLCESYARNLAFYRKIHPEFRLSTALKMNELERARAALQALKREWGIPLDSPPCAYTSPIENPADDETAPSHPRPLV